MRSSRLLVTSLSALGVALTAAASSWGQEVSTTARLRREEARQALAAGDLERAHRQGQQAVELDPHCAECWALLGRILAQNRRFLGAEDALRRAQELGAADSGLLLTLGSVLWENGRAAAAEATLRALADGETDTADLARHQLGRLWLWQGRYDIAAIVLRQVAERRGATHEARLDLARALDGAGEIREARRQYEAYLEHVPDDAGAVYGLAMNLQRAGEGRAAGQWLRRYGELQALERDNNLALGRMEAEIDQARHLLATGRPAEAARHLRSLDADATVLGLLARALRASGEPAAALEILERAVALDPGRTDLRTLLQEWRLASERSP